MKKLNNFISFDLNGFLKDKKLILVSANYVNSEYFVGAKADVVIVEDNTIYGKDKDNNDIIGVNAYEKFSVKVPEVDKNYISQLQLNKPVRLSQDSKATIYKPEGQFAVSQLTVVGKLIQNNEQKQH